MRKLKSLLFVPETPVYYSSFDKPSSFEDSGFLTLKEKIKADPTMRERLKCEAKILAGINGVKKTSRRRSVKQAVEDVQREDAKVLEDNGELSYIKNMTETDVVLNFYENVSLKKGERPPKPPVVKRFMAKWELTDEQLDSPVFKRLFKSGILTLVTEAQMRKEKNILDRKEQQSMVDLERRKREAAMDREGNSHRDVSGLRRIGGVSINDIDTGGIVDDLTEVPNSATAGDGGVIHFDINPNERSRVSREDAEMNNLMRSIVKESSPGDSSSGADLSSIGFSTGEYKT